MFLNTVEAGTLLYALECATKCMLMSGCVGYQTMQINVTHVHCNLTELPVYSTADSTSTVNSEIMISHSRLQEQPLMIPNASKFGNTLSYQLIHVYILVIYTELMLRIT